MSDPRTRLEYWQIIRWDANSFLTLHDGENSRLYYDRASLSLAETLRYGCRASLGGVVRFLQGFLRSLWKRFPPGPACEPPYLLLITVGTDKFASEEREIVEAFKRRGLGVLTVHLDGEASVQNDGGSLSVASCLRPVDYLRALSRWLQELISGSPLLLTRNSKQRALYVCAIPAIRQFCTHEALARRIIGDHGLPRLLLSLCPGAALSVAVVEYMKKRGVRTSGIRAQPTGCSPENLAINTEVLFCKSSLERRAYEELFAGAGPRLEKGCVLSLPEPYLLEPLPLPERYVLLLGTAPRCDCDLRDYERFNERLFGLAAVTGLPVVFKGHNLGKELDDAWLARSLGKRPDCVRVIDIRRNRELIDGAAIVLSAPSTLLYWAILAGKPIVVIEPKNVQGIVNDLQCAPILRFAWDQDIVIDGPLERILLQCSPEAVREWFEKNYFLESGPDWIAGALLEGVRGGSPAFPPDRRDPR